MDLTYVLQQSRFILNGWKFTTERMKHPIGLFIRNASLGCRRSGTALFVRLFSPQEKMHWLEMK